MLVLQDKIAEINAKMSEGELKKLKEKTDEVEQRIKTIESKIQFKNNEIVQQNQQIEFQNTVIQDNEERIVHTKAENVELEKDKVKFAEEMKVQRALKTLEEINIIKIHKYWKNKEHFNSIIKDACNFYQIMPFSNYSSDFKLTYEKELILIEKDKIDMKKLKAKREQAKKAKSSNSLLELIENSKKIFEKQP